MFIKNFIDSPLVRDFSDFDVPDHYLDMKTQAQSDDNMSEEYDQSTEPDNDNSRDLYILILIILLLLILIYALRRYIFKDTTANNKKKSKNKNDKKNLSMLSSGSTFVRSILSKHISADSSRSKHATSKSKSRIKSKRKCPKPKRKITISKLPRAVSERN